MKKFVLSTATILFLASIFVACEKQGKMEEMGEKADNMLEDASDKAKDLNDELKKKLKNATSD